MKTRLEELQNMLSEDPNDVFVHYAVGLELFKNGAIEEATNTMIALIDSHPDYIPAYFRLGQWFAEQDNMEKSKEILTKALDLAKIQNDTKAGQEIKELLLFIEDYED
jgi:tetratricopeptide (TPR) repeat protein